MTASGGAEKARQPATAASISVSTGTRTAEWRATCALITICAIWGSTFTLVKNALQDASPLLFLTLRFGVALLALTVAFRLKGALGPVRALMPAGILTGIALFGGYLFQTVGLRFTTPARSAFLTGMFIVFVPVLLSLARRRLPQPREFVGILTATSGLYFLTSPLEWNDIALGDLLTLICAASYALHIVLLGRFSVTADVRTLTLLQIGVAFVASAASFWWAEAPVYRPSVRLWSAVVITGVLATAAAFFVQTWAQRMISPTRTACIFALEPLFAWFTSFLVMGERFSRAGALGAVLILAGILLVENDSHLTTAAEQGPHPSGPNAGL